MEWIVFALLAPAIWAMNCVTAKILIDKKFSKPFPFAILFTLIDTIFIVPVFLLTSISFLFPYILYAIIAGIISFITFWFYFNALKVEEVSRISSLTQITPIFVTILSTIFLNEILSPKQYIGIVIIVIASALISYKKVKGKSHLSSALKFVIAFALILSIYMILIKYTLNYIDPWSFFLWSVVGTFLMVPCILSIQSIRRDFVKTVKIIDKKTIFVIIFNESLWFFGYVAALIAASGLYISLVSTIGSLEPFFVLVYAVVLSIFIPRLLKEEIKKSTIAVKLFAISLIFIGMWMLNVL